ncbi:MAG: hypothetical protein J5518_11145 [Lachnospiraceae bacterium]|nr:hypothetical protein [Lachnospiraceae bacterium]
MNFEHELDSYQPKKDHYNFYSTYKTVCPWWDAVALGMEEAQRQYLDRGITVTYEYMAPAQAFAEDQYLSDVFERADRMMYERKKELKELGTPSGRP